MLEETRAVQWSRRLAAGERMWLYRDPVSILVALLTTFVGLALGLAAVTRVPIYWFFPVRYTGNWHLDDVHFVAIPDSGYTHALLAIVAFCILGIAAVLWGRILFTWISFTDKTLFLKPSRRRLEEITIADIAAVGLAKVRNLRGGATWGASVCIPDVDKPGNWWWYQIYAGGNQTATALCWEISRRCHLGTVLQMTKSTTTATVWRRQSDSFALPGCPGAMQ
jgi:hypothetical protein